MNVTRLSVTQVLMFTRCAKAWEYRYLIDGKPSPPSGAMIRGSAFHKAVEENMGQKVETHQDLPKDWVMDVFDDVYEDLVLETKWKENEDRGKVKDQGYDMLSEYHQTVAPTIQPVQVEQDFAVLKKVEDPANDVSEEFIVSGVVDLIDDKNVIIETKTSGRKVSKPKPDHVFQASTYADAYRIDTGNLESGVRLDYATAGKTPGVLQFPIEVTDSMIRFVDNQIEAVARAIALEIFIPNRGNMLCSPNWCAWYYRCLEDCGG